MVSIKKYIAVFPFMFLMLGLIFSANGQPSTESEYKLKAAFIYNFAKFIDWSDEIHRDQSRSFIIGILGENPFGNELDIIRGKKIRNSKIEIKQYKDIDEIQDCSILFISSSERKNITKLITGLKRHKILTVGDTSGYAHKGVMINLYKSNNKLRFEINNKAAKSAGLKISSHLLKLGKIVDIEDQGG